MRKKSAGDGGTATVRTLTVFVAVNSSRIVGQSIRFEDPSIV